MTEEKPKEKYNIKQVPTQTEDMICEDDTPYTDREVLLLLLRKVDNLEKKIVGE